MRLRRVIQRKFHRDDDGVKVEGGLNAAIDINVGEGGGKHQRTSSHSRIVQRSASTAAKTPPDENKKSEGEGPGKDRR
jgi:hypothetical protein